MLIMSGDKAALYQEYSIREGTCFPPLTRSVARCDMSEQDVGRKTKAAVGGHILGHILPFTEFSLFPDVRRGQTTSDFGHTDDDFLTPLSPWSSTFKNTLTTTCESETMVKH
jgi:hypothetical protein